MDKSKNFVVPDYTQHFVFTTLDNKRLRTLKADFKYIDKERTKWGKDNPLPEPPLVKPDPRKKWSLKLARRVIVVMSSKKMKKNAAEEYVADRAEFVPDDKDGAYLAQVDLWEKKRYMYVERILISKYLIHLIDGDYMTLEHLANSPDVDDLTGKYLESPTIKIVADVLKTKERYELMNHFVKTSQLTWELVLEMGDQIGIMREGSPILRVIPMSGDGEPQSITGQGKIAAVAMAVTPIQYDAMTIENQGEILALHLSMKWQEHFNYQDAKAQRS